VEAAEQTVTQLTWGTSAQARMHLFRLATEEKADLVQLFRQFDCWATLVRPVEERNLVMELEVFIRGSKLTENSDFETGSE
jgi:hypothetical protein